MTEALLRANRRTFLSLRKHRNYRLFFAGQVVSVSGTWMQNIAAAWLVLALTGSPVAVGILALCQFLPFTVFSLLAGVIVDRFDARRLVVATQAAAMALAVALAAVTFTGVVEAWHVFVLAALRGVTLVLDTPARQALTFQMVGPALGGFIIATAGVAICFAVNAVSFLAVLAGLLAMDSRELRPVARREEPPRLLAGTREALAYVAATPVAAVVLATVLVVSVFSFNFNVLLPVLAKETLGGDPQVFGFISACFGGGALVGALTSATIGRASRKVFLVGTGGFGLAQLLLAPQASVLAAAALLFVAGLCFTLWTSNANATLQLAAPDHLRGRVLGLYFFVFNGTMPAGGLLAGWLAERDGTLLAFAVAGGAATAATAIAFVFLRSGRRAAEAERARRVATIDSGG